MTFGITNPPLLVGMTVGDALVFCGHLVPGGWLFRVTCRDGVHLPVTRDYKTDRINVDVVDGKIISQYIG